MLKPLLFTLVACCLLNFQLAAQDHFTLSGTIHGIEQGKVRISYQNADGINKIDSCVLKDGQFTFTGVVNGFSRTFFWVYNGQFNPKLIDPNNFTNYFIDGSNIGLNATSGHLDKLQLTGSKPQDDYNLLNSQLEVVRKRFAPIAQRTRYLQLAVDSAKKQHAKNYTIDSLEQQLTREEEKRWVFLNEYNRITKAFIKSHPNSYISPVLLLPYVADSPPDSVKAILEKFNPKIKNTFAYQEIEKQLDQILAHSANAKATNFQTVNLHGKSVSLNSYRGKYVLLDFWGSWCVPCRASNPHLIAIYKQYNSAGLEIIAVAQEKGNDQKEWQKAIAKDHTDIWDNVIAEYMDIKGTTRSIVKDYNITAFPTKILIDPQGMIIGRYVGTQEEPLIDKKLKEILEK